MISNLINSKYGFWAKVIPIVLCSSLLLDYRTWIQNVINWYKETIEKGGKSFDQLFNLIVILIFEM